MIIKSKFTVPDYMAKQLDNKQVVHLAAKRIADDIALQVLKNFKVRTYKNEDGETVKEMELRVTAVRKKKD